MTKRILVTGASGRLGGYVTPRLLEAGHDVTDFDSVDHPVVDGPQAAFIKGDLTSLEDCLRALTYSEADTIVHLGALPGPREMIKGRPNWATYQRAPEDETMRVNTMGTYYLLDAARRLGMVKRVVMASSFYTLGLGNRISSDPFAVDYLPIDEDHPLRPEDSYGLSKVFGEELLRAYIRAYGITAVAFRLMGIHFPHNDNSAKYGVTPESRPDHVGGPIVTTYQYVDARDVANACALAVEATGLDPFEPMYLSTDTVYNENTKDLAARVWPDLAEMAANIPGHDGVITDARARKKLGYEPQHSWRTNK
ncbi:MAG: NAD-dependent epimerase/dehydratase family protein [Sciscionella sp.]